MGAQLGETTGVVAREELVELFVDHKLQDRVAQEFKPIIIVEQAFVVFAIEQKMRSMSESALEEVAVLCVFNFWDLEFLRYALEIHGVIFFR